MIDAVGAYGQSAARRDRPGAWAGLLNRRVGDFSLDFYHQLSIRNSNWDDHRDLVFTTSGGVVESRNLHKISPLSRVYQRNRRS